MVERGLAGVRCMSNRRSPIYLGGSFRGEYAFQDRVGLFERARADLAELVRVRRPEIEETILACVANRAVERAGSEDPEYTRGLRAGVEALLDAGLAGVEQRQPGVGMIPPTVVAQGHQAAPVDGGTAVASEGVVQDQRARILRALVEVAAEHGFGCATVALVVTRARVSTRTFYQLFDGLEECLIAVMDGALEQVVALAAQELAGATSWQDGVRSALAAVLSFFDTEPELARVCIVETLAGGPTILKHREAVVESFRLPVAEWIERNGPATLPLATEGVMSSVLGIMHAHMVEQKPGPFIELLGPLMGLVTAPYLNTREVEAEIKHGDELARAILARDSRWSKSKPRPDAAREAGPGARPGVGRSPGLSVEQDALPAVLVNPSARRARECLMFLAEQCGRGLSPSNREIAAGIGVAHLSQISKLLTLLAEEGLVVKRSEGAGKRNAWRLTPQGEQVALAISGRVRRR